MYHTAGYLDFVLNPANATERDIDDTSADPTELETMKAEYGLEDVDVYSRGSDVCSRVLMNSDRIALYFPGYLHMYNSWLVQHLRPSTH